MDWIEIRPSWLREILDLQYRSIRQALREQAQGRDFEKCTILDFGSRQSPFRDLLSPHREYRTLDPYSPSDYRSLTEIPAGKTFQLILATEVLEHTQHPESVLKELKSRLANDGELWITTPFSGRINNVPNDYWRWSEDGLKELLSKSGLTADLILTRGTDIVVLCAKFNFLIFRWVRRLITAPLAIILGLHLLWWLLPLAHLCLHFDIGSKDDPLGYLVIARPRS